jgi:hypothetical protein
VAGRDRQREQPHKISQPIQLEGQFQKTVPTALLTRNRLIPSTSAIPISKARERQEFQRQLAGLAPITRVIRRDVHPLPQHSIRTTVNRG